MSTIPFKVGDIEYDDDNDDDEGFFTTPVLIGVAAGGGVILIAAVALIIRGRKRGGKNMSSYKGNAHRNDYFASSNPMVEMNKQVSTHFSSAELPKPQKNDLNWGSGAKIPTSPEATV